MPRGRAAPEIYKHGAGPLRAHEAGRRAGTRREASPTTRLGNARRPLPNLGNGRRIFPNLGSEPTTFPIGTVVVLAP